MDSKELINKIHGDIWYQIAYLTALLEQGHEVTKKDYNNLSNKIAEILTTQIGKANQVDADVIPKIADKKYKPETQFVIYEDGKYDLIYNLKERKNRRIHQEVYENDVTISIGNNIHLTIEQKKEIAKVIMDAMNSNFSV